MAARSFLSSRSLSASGLEAEGVMPRMGGGRAATGAGASVEPVAFLIVDSIGTPHLETVGKSPAAPPSSRDRIIEMIREQVLKRFGGESKEDESDDNGQG